MDSNDLENNKDYMLENKERGIENGEDLRNIENTSDYQNIDSNSETNEDISVISNETPLLNDAFPNIELTEKPPKAPSFPSHQRGVTVETNATNFELENDGPLVPLLELPGPPDGGWGWVICFASFMCNFIVDGIVYSFGVLLPQLVEEFKSTKSAVSWAGSLVPGLYMGAGPIVGGLVNKFGCRPVCIAGGIVACVSLVLSTFAPNVPLLMLTYGLMGGFGCGMIYLPSIVSVGYYFEKRRALATGIAVCGSGVGCFTFAPLANFLLENFDWKWTNRIFGGFALICSLMGALMRPLELASKHTGHDEEMGSGSRRASSYSTHSHGNPNSMRTFTSINPSKAAYFTPDEILEEEEEYQSSQSRKSSQKTEEEDYDYQKNKLDEADEQFNIDIKESANEEPKKINLISRGIESISNTIRSRHTSIHESHASPSILVSTGADANRDTFLRSMLRQNSLNVQNSNNPNSITTAGPLMRKNVSTPQFGGRLTRINSTASNFASNEKRDSVADLVYGVADGTELFLQDKSIFRTSQAPILRPLARKDIFYSGSILNIALPPPLPENPPPVKFNNDDDIDENMDVPSNLNRYRYSIISMPKHERASALHRGSIVTTHLDIEPATIGKNDGLLDEKLEITRPLMSVLKEMVDFASYMCNPIFLMIAISNVLGFLAVYIPYVYLPDMMTKERGIDATKASFVISLIGVSNTLGRIVLGALVDCVPWNNTALVVTNLCLVLSGVCVFSFPFCLDYLSFVVCALLLGLFVSGYISLTSIVLVDLLGIDSLTSTFGLLVLFRGIASVLGPPLGGLVYESTNQDYATTFYMAGSFFVAAGVISEVAHLIYISKEKNQNIASPEEEKIKQ